MRQHLLLVDWCVWSHRKFVGTIISNQQSSHLQCCFFWELFLSFWHVSKCTTRLHTYKMTPRHGLIRFRLLWKGRTKATMVEWTKARCFLVLIFLALWRKQACLLGFLSNALLARVHQYLEIDGHGSKWSVHHPDRTLFTLYLWTFGVASRPS